MKYDNGSLCGVLRKSRDSLAINESLPVLASQYQLLLTPEIIFDDRGRDSQRVLPFLEHFAQLFRAKTTPSGGNAQRFQDARLALSIAADENVDEFGKAVFGGLEVAHAVNDDLMESQ